MSVPACSRLNKTTKLQSAEIGASPKAQPQPKPLACNQLGALGARGVSPAV